MSVLTHAIMSNLSRCLRAPHLSHIARLSALSFTLIALPTDPSFGSPFEVYGVGSRASSLGHTGAASARTYSAVYYNPAALSQARHGVGGGVTYALKDLEVNLSKRPEGYDIPNLGSLSPSVPSEFTLEPRRGQDSVDHSLNLWFGASTDLGTERFSLGALVSLPVYHSRD